MKQAWRTCKYGSWMSWLLRYVHRVNVYKDVDKRFGTNDYRMESMKLSLYWSTYESFYTDQLEQAKFWRTRYIIK